MSNPPEKDDWRKPAAYIGIGIWIASMAAYWRGILLFGLVIGFFCIAPLAWPYLKKLILKIKLKIKLKIPNKSSKFWMGWFLIILTLGMVMMIVYAQYQHIQSNHRLNIYHKYEWLN